MSFIYRIISLLICSSSAFGTKTYSSLVNSSDISGTVRCVSTFPTICTDEMCFGITIRHKEGKIIRLGCLSSLNVEESLDCKTALSLSRHNSTCIDTGVRRVCCCFPASKQCNSMWIPILRLPHLNTEEAVLLIIGVVLIIAVYYVANKILNFATITWGQEVAISGFDRIISIELNIGLIKVMLIFILLLSVWYPVLPECQDHDEGVFEEKYYFIAQLVNSYMTGLLFSIYPILLVLLDFNRLRFMSMRAFICHRAHTLISSSATIFSFVPVSLFIVRAIDLYHREMSTTYCKLGKQLLRLALCILLYIVYAMIAIIQEVASLFFTQKTRTPLDTVSISENIMLDESFGDQLETAKSESVVNGDDCLRVTPRPFVLDCHKEGVLSLENLQANEWITLRVITSAPKSYIIYPRKVIIPPKRSSTVSVRLREDAGQRSSQEAGIMLQWFTVGKNCPCVDVTRLWERPYIIPRSRWKFYVLPVYHDSQDTLSDRQPVTESRTNVREDTENN